MSQPTRRATGPRIARQMIGPSSTKGMPMNPRRSNLVRGALIVPFLCGSLFSASATAQAPSTKPAVQNLREIAKVLSACMQPLVVAEPYQGMRVTVRIGFNARGQPLGPPVFTYVTPNASDRIKNQYKSTISDALKRCTPLSFSPGLGAAIAGVPIILSFNERPVMRAGLGVSPVYF
jgi:hypothetical protein